MSKYLKRVFTMASKWFTEQPKNRNFLSPVGFKLDLDLFPAVDFFCQTAQIPDISAPFVEVPTRFRGVPIASSGGVRFGDLRVRFIIDEDMVNYLSIHDWITKNNLAETMDNQPDPEYSSGQLTILNSNNRANLFVRYDNLFPIDLSEVSFDVGDEDLQYITADVTFKFTSYEFFNKTHRRI